MLRILTDSSANIPNDILKQYDISIVPFHYYINGVEYAAYNNTADFDGKAFYDSMRNGNVIKTSMINITDFENAFGAVLEKGDDLIYIGMSSGISGAFNAARIAADTLKEQYPDRKIAVVDSLAASMGQGLQVIDAAIKQAQGGTFEEIIKTLNKERASLRQFFTVDNLKYLVAGGRLSAAVAKIGTLLNIKPILTGINGRIVLCGKIRGRFNALEELARRFVEQVKNVNLTVAIAHADCKEAAEYLAGRLKELGQKAEIIITCYEPVTGSHVGPGTVALFFKGKEVKQS